LREKRRPNREERETSFLHPLSPGLIPPGYDSKLIEDADRLEVEQAEATIRVFGPFAQGRASIADFRKVYARPAPLPSLFYMLGQKATVPPMSSEVPLGPPSGATYPSLQVLQLIGIKGEVQNALNHDEHFLHCFIMYAGRCAPDLVETMLARLRAGETVPIMGEAFHQALRHLLLQELTGLLTRQYAGGTVPTAGEAFQKGLQHLLTHGKVLTIWQELVWFETAGWRLHRCRYGEHWYIADYHKQYGCVVHQKSGRQKRYRVKHQEPSRSNDPEQKGGH
jgi:hypothetical protein